MSQSPGRNQQPVATYRSYWKILLISLNIGLSFGYMGFSSGYFNSINFDDIMSIYGMKSNRAFAQGFLTGCIPISAGFGAWYSQFLIQRFSRRQSLIYMNVLIIISTVFLQIPKVWILVVSRLVQGLCMGLAGSLAPLYSKQLMPNELRGSMGSLNQTVGSIGILVSFTIAYLFSLVSGPQVYWRIVFIVPALTAGFQTFMLVKVFPYETPKYLLQQARDSEARELIETLYQDKYIDQIFQQYRKDLGRTVSSKQNSDNFGIELQEMDGSKKTETREGLLPVLKELKEDRIHPTNKVAIFTSIHLALLNQLTGISVLISYFGEIILLTMPAAEKVFPIFLHLLATICGLIGMKLIQNYGRVYLYQKGMFIMTVSVFLVAFFFFVDFWISPYMIIFLIFVFRAGFSTTVGPLSWLYIAEIVQANILPYSTMAKFLAGSCSVILFPIVQEKLLGGNPGGLFLFFGVYGILGYIVNRKILVQTKDQTELQIRKLYDLKFQKWKG